MFFIKYSSSYFLYDLEWGNNMRLPSFFMLILVLSLVLLTPFSSVRANEKNEVPVNRPIPQTRDSQPTIISERHAVIETVVSKVVSIDKQIRLDAVVESVNQTTLTAQTSGQITDIYFDGGDNVAAGSVLIRLSDKQQQASFQATEASVKSNKAELVDAISNWKRIKDIFEKKLTSQQSLDNAKARLNIARAHHDEALAKLKNEKEQLSYTVVKAPYAGIVLERHVNLGEVVAPGTPLFTGTSLNQLRIVAQIPQRNLEEVRRHSEVIITLPNQPPLLLSDNALNFYAYASANSSTFKVRLKLPQGEYSLYPGMYVKAAFKTGQREATIIPRSALVVRSELRAVYIIDRQGNPRLRQIRVGQPVSTRLNENQLAQSMVEVIAGLNAGEKVVVNPHAAIKALAVSRLSETNNARNDQVVE
jgi:membrane fusion protein, multidrug efflux system